MTVLEATYDVLHRLGQISDDAKVEPRLVQQWLNTSRLGLLEDYFKANGEEIPPSMIKKWECQPLLTETACDGCPSRYIDLPANVIDLKSDIGVFAIKRPGGKEIDRYGAPGLGNLISGSRFAGSGYTRIGNRVEFYGKFPEGIQLTFYLVYSGMDQFSDTDPFPAPAGLMDDIIEQATLIGMRRLGMLDDVTNDGADK